MFSGDQLKEKYDGATEVKINRRGKLQVKHPQFNVPTGEDLVYLLESPDYCKRNKTVGSLGKGFKISLLQTKTQEWKDHDQTFTNPHQFFIKQF